MINIRPWFVMSACIVFGGSIELFGGDCTPPPNEDCDGQIAFSNEDLPFEVVAPLGCTNNMVDRPYFDVFYRFDCDVTGDYTLDMCGSTGDTYLRVYTGACGWVGGDELIVGDDECGGGSPPQVDPQVTVRLFAGTSYWIELGTWRASPPFIPPLNSPYRFNFSTPNCAPPEITSEPTDVVGCLGGQAMLSVAAEGGETVSYQWRKFGVIIPDAVSATLIVENLEPGDAGDYDVVVSNGCGSEFSGEAMLEVATRADFNADGVVTIEDYGVFVTCSAFNGEADLQQCGCADSDRDGDVDFADFGAFQIDYSELVR